MIEGPQNISSLQQATQQKTKITIFNYTTPAGNYYFTLCDKKPENVGFNHPRILVFEEVQGIVYYVNSPDKWPLKDSSLSTPKNEKAFLNLCQVKNESGNELNITFNKKSDKDKVVPGQWVFVMDSKNVAKEWVNLIYNKKNQRITRAILNSPSNKQQIKQDQPNTANNKVEDPNFLNPNPKPEQSNVKRSRIQQNKQDLNKSLGQSNSSMRLTVPVQNKMSQSKGPNNLNINKSPNQTSNIQPSNNPANKNQFNNSYGNYGREKQPASLNTSTQPYEKAKSNVKSEVKDTNQKGSTISALNNKPINESAYKNTSNNQSYAPSRREPDSTFKREDLKKSNPPPFSYPNKSSTIQDRPSIVQDRPISNQGPSLAKKQSSSYKNQGQKDDWNLMFLQNRTEKTIKNFTQVCLQIFLALNPEGITLRAETQSRDEQVMPKKFVRDGITFYMAQYGTKAAQNLRRQFKNYHFILESCKEIRIIHVPLTCLIQHLGIICLAKANLAQPYQVVDFVTNNDPNIEHQLRSLETFTKISSEALRKWGIVCNLTKRYGKQGKYDRIYVDNLTEYLPRNPEFNGSAVRPQLIVQNITKTLHPKSPEYQSQISNVLSSALHKITQVLSQHQLIIASYDDLRQIIHDFGLNNAMLPTLYSSVRSRFVKKYLYTAMLATLAKQDIIMSMVELRESQKLNRLMDGIEEIFRIYFQAHTNDPAYVQLWKNLSQQFKKKYRINFSLHEIEPGFFLSSIMSIIHADYDIEKINKNKELLNEREIIGKGFIVELKPIVKSYTNYVTERNSKLINLCKYPISNLNDVTSIMPLSQICSSVHSKQQKQILARLSSIISPFSSQNKQLISNIYSVTNQEPPCLTSHSTTISFADHCQKEGRLQQYKRTVEKAVDIINFWLGDEHMLLCDVFESLADYYEGKGQAQDCINYMKQSLTTCIRQTGTHTNRVGIQYFKLAQKQLKYGQNKDALENYYKFKANIENSSHKTLYYPVGLMRIGNLQLNQGQVQKCISLCIKAIRSSEQIEIPDSTLIKVYDLLLRAYELNQNRQQMLNLSHLAAKMFNSTNNQFAFDQMVRICLVGFIGTLQPGRRDKLLEYIRMNKEFLEQRRKPKQATNKLMDAANSYNVMQRFVKCIEELDKLISQIKHNRHQSAEGKQFRFLFECIVQIVGLQFVEGILQQSQYW